MALSDENGMVMPVAPMNGGFGGFGGNDGGWWTILLFIILLCNGGWNNGGFNGNGSNGLYPWMNQANLTSDGFQNQLMNDNITSIRNGVNGIETQLCNGFGGVQMSLCNGFAGVEQGANARQVANMQQAFAGQTATTNAITNLSNQLSECCCENRLATCQTQNVITAESANTRFADANNTRDIIENANRNNQAILDKLCQLELDAKNDKISDLERQLTMANLQASQIAQNSFIAQGFTDEVDALYNRLSNCPVPSTPVYGRTPIFNCNNNGCGCGNF